MKILTIDCDVNAFQTLYPVDENLSLEFLTFDCERKTNWGVVDFYIFNPKKKRSDFFYVGSTGTFGFNSKVLEVMRTIFEMAGEILPIKIEGEHEEYYILNVLECVNALDKKKSIWIKDDDTGEDLTVEGYKFFSSRLSESSIFKIPETSRAEILTYADIKNKDDEFYYLYMLNNFSGLIFNTLYSE